MFINLFETDCYAPRLAEIPQERITGREAQRGKTNIEIVEAENKKREKHKSIPQDLEKFHKNEQQEEKRKEEKLT